MRAALISGLALGLALAAGCGGGSDLGLYDPEGLDSIGALRAARQELRAYDGAPPVIPHEIAGRGREDCNSCHTPGAPTNPERLGPPRSHPAWGDCRQCHVEQIGSGMMASSNLEPLRWPASGSRLYASAPPTIPHSTQNRESCGVCHVGEQAPKALRADHGDRLNCTQCHADGST